MHRLGAIISVIDHALDSKRKKHIAGGILLSSALLLGSLAVTIMTLKPEEGIDEHYIE